MNAVGVLVGVVSHYRCRHNTTVPCAIGETAVCLSGRKKGRMKSVVFLTAYCVTFSANAFSPMRTRRPAYRSTTRLYSSTETKEKAVEMKEEPLSDLDARVLKEMLQQDKLDVSDEENLKKLLERGVAPKSAPSFEKEEPDYSDSPFVSTVFKVCSVLSI